jgi:hypothetical protein
MPIGKPLFEFAAAARTTNLLNFPHRFHCAIDILDDKTCLSFNNNFGDRTDGKRLAVKADDLLTAFISLERDALAPKGANGNATR